MWSQTDKKRDRIIRELTNYIRIPRVLESLMHKKKVELNSDQDHLVFVGAADMAEYFWCAEKSVLKSRDSEIMFFESYLIDRISYSFDLGRLDSMPGEENKLLSVGDDITKSDIEYLLKERKMEASNDELSFSVAREGQWRSLGIVSGTCYVLGFPDERAKEMIATGPEIREIVFVNSLEDPHLPSRLRGVVGEDAYAEKYPSIRWNFTFGKYILIGAPDGITENFVYEFKTTKDIFLERFIKPVAYTQGDLYGHFFGRKVKRVQIRNYQLEKTFTYQSAVNDERIREVYDGFQKIESGGKAIPPAAWKCKNCEFRASCPISQA